MAKLQEAAYRAAGSRLYGWSLWAFVDIVTGKMRLHQNQTSITGAQRRSGSGPTHLEAYQPAQGVVAADDALVREVQVAGQRKGERQRVLSHGAGAAGGEGAGQGRLCS